VSECTLCQEAPAEFQTLCLPCLRAVVVAGTEFPAEIGPVEAP
jgi:hypothetical protein